MTAVKKISPQGAGGVKEKKSGLKVLKAGELLFREGDGASSLFIIQKGQLRLFRPKGAGFVELATLRSGEVIGEMAYFDDSAAGGRRSCSAEAMMHTEIIEISFEAFGKTLGNLNPWFKTIVTTLAQRLKQTNARVKEIETNSLDYNESGGKDYKFIKTNELLKILSTFYLVFSTHGKEDPQGSFLVNKNTLTLYTKDIYNIIEVKFESIMQILISLNIIDMRKDEKGFPNIFALKDKEYLKSLFTFYNAEKFLTDDKKMKINAKCKVFLEELFLGIKKGALKPEEPETKKKTPFKLINISGILNDFKNRNLGIDVDDLEDAQRAIITGETYVVDSTTTKLDVSVEQLNKLYPIICFMDDFNKMNQGKKF